MRQDQSIILLSIISVGFVLRLFLAYNSTGFPVDINTYKAWAEYLATKGFSDFYTAGHFIDYPPFYLFVFYLIGKLRYLFGLDFASPTYHLILKLPSLIAEIFSACLLIHIAKKKMIPPRVVIISTTVFIFNPVIIIDSALWGQIDSFLALFILGFMIAMIEKRHILAASLFTLSIMIKPQALVFTPIFLAYVVSLKDIKVAFNVFITMILTILPLLIPFSLTQGFMWIPKLLETMFSEYPFATLNTFNFYALIGKNWASTDEYWLFLPFKTWGFIAILLITLMSIYLFLRSRHEYKIVLISLITALSVFMFSVKMHERYMVTSMVIFALAYLLTKDKKVLYLFIGFSVTNTVNLAYTLILAHIGIYHIPPKDLILRGFSLINLCLYVLALRWLIPNLIGGNTESKKLNSTSIFELPQCKIDLTLNKRDVIALICICVFFTLLYFYSLGSVYSPQTYWQPKMKGEGFIIDLKTPQDIRRINYFSGIGKGIYRVDVSDDLIKWQTIATIEQKDVFQWKYIQVDNKTRYLNIIVIEPDGMLYEIGLFDKNRNLIQIENLLNIVSSEKTVGSFKNLFDEQRMVPYTPSYRNGTYFDEIYYARTAFEYIQGLLPYETTHPPLGKLIIATGIKIFGMTPFGWRVMGVLSGIVIIAFVYLFGRMLFGKTEYGVLSAMIMGFDFMTFVQARLATIDSISVMFIVMMTYFMMRFYLSDNYHSCIRNMTLSAISFSLGVATKWLCIYTALGLAVLFFLKLYKLSRNTDIKKYLIYGILLFVILPTIVYTVTYLIILPKPITFAHIKTIIQTQYHMYQYHKGIVSSHPFASSWWQWPIIYKPMWLYMAPDMPRGIAGSIVTMGNPIVWWTGLVTFSLIVFGFVRYKRVESYQWLIVLFVAVNYLPWLLVPRETYIYHFYATVPFWILSIVYWLGVLKDANQGSRLFRYLPFIYLILVALMFLMFYPILSGLEVNKSYIRDYLQWFSSWIFFVPD
ncbi:MAG: glycosyltransferase family 39 protein [Thermodesulfovibrionales bacterium]|nr:glycosyltransferase family 39 protein [Thermodesulfovibrionales bacterium]